MGHNRRKVKRVTVKCNDCQLEVTVYGTRAANRWMDEHEPQCPGEPVNHEEA